MYNLQLQRHAFWDPVGLVLPLRSIQSERSVQEIIRSPQRIQRAGAVSVEPRPRLAFAAPMQEADWTRMQIPTKTSEIISAKAVLVPAMINRRYVACKDQQEGRQRTQLVYSHPLLQLHPFFNLGRVIPRPPSIKIYHHHPRVEVARLPVRERQ
ncbi:hypothetical protein CISIN_1g031748mg [Citrus sinensis]|uniref:Uncharacterized protein n=1 Tax=Citrus sinensis TaxID=2711 RepID=A0A067H9W7_CITSI|nr:hypothetical protein CISIN_1g031748mg [Citrus sinensis]